MNQKNINRLTKQNTLNVNDGPQNCVNVLEGQSNLLAGGSIASDMVNQLSPKDCCTLLPNNVLNTLTKDFVIANYGSNFKTTGGGKNFSINFIQSIVDNLEKKIPTDNILKNMTTFWNKYNNNKLTNKNSKIILNDFLNTNPHLQKSFNNKFKKGGARTVLPLKWFKPEYNYPYTAQNTNMEGMNCPCPKSLPNAYNNINYYPYYRNSCTMNNMKGGTINAKVSNADSVRFLPWNQDTTLTGYRIDGDSVPTGAHIPLTPIQRINNHLNGTDPIFAPNKSDITNLIGAQTFCDHGDCSADMGFTKDMINPNECVTNFDSSILSEGKISDLPSATPNESYTGPLWSPDIFDPKNFTPPKAATIPNQRAGSRKKNNKSKKTIRKN